MKKRLLFLSIQLLVVSASFVWGQEATVIDRKGTLKKVTSNSFTVSATQPVEAVEADMWYSVSDSINRLYVFDQDLNDWVMIQLADYNKVTNEIFLEDLPNGYLYVSLMVNDQWKVIRYEINDVNSEAETGQASNPSVTQQPTTLAQLQTLSF